ncbi:MAG: cystathionine beta-lyase [Candidatus Cybelea sp.]
MLTLRLAALAQDRLEGRPGEGRTTAVMGKSWQTRLIHPGVKAPAGYNSLAVPVYRGSTTLFSSASAVTDAWDQERAGYTYGLYGTPTSLELAARLCELEGGRQTILTPGGQSAISLIDFALLRAGDHVLVPLSAYRPNRQLTTSLLAHFGVEATFYDPLAGAAIADLIQANTRLVWTESPGSVTMEVQDVPAIAAAAHARDIIVALDNTWSAGVLFDAFAHGVDVTMQALTKYVGGHSDLLLGSITVRDDGLYRRLGAARQVIGCAVSPDECSLALRGLQTLAVRLSALETSALEVARWLAGRPEVERVLHPALPTCPGHEFWKRDFAGSSGVFSIVLAPGPSRERVCAFVDALQLFEIGYSWGGTTSLAVAYTMATVPNRPRYDHRLVRLSIGLESTDDLIADLEAALPMLRGRYS